MRGRSIIAAAAAALLGVAVAAPAQATTTVTVHRFAYQDTSVPSGDPAGAQGATIRFVYNGVKINVPTSQDYAYGVFHANKRLNTVRNIGWQFVSSNGGDIAQYFAIDADGNGTEDGDFTGERAYGGQDVWLQSGASEAMKRAAPSCDHSDAVATSPMDAASGAALIAAGHCTGGSGSAWHGTLAQWSAALPRAVVLDSGFQVFDQAVQGRLVSMNVGSTVYKFKK